MFGRLFVNWQVQLHEWYAKPWRCTLRTQRSSVNCLQACWKRVSRSLLLSRLWPILVFVMLVPSKILTKGLTGLIRLTNRVAVTIALKPLKLREEFAFPHYEAWAWWRLSCIADSPSWSAPKRLWGPAKELPSVHWRGVLEYVCFVDWYTISMGIYVMCDAMSERSSWMPQEKSMKSSLEGGYLLKCHVQEVVDGVLKVRKAELYVCHLRVGTFSRL